VEDLSSGRRCGRRIEYWERKWENRRRGNREEEEYGRVKKLTCALRCATTHEMEIGEPRLGDGVTHRRRRGPWPALEHQV